MGKRKSRAVVFNAEHKVRMAAVNAAATFFSGDREYTSAELWAITVFFEAYICTGAKGTQKDFGPPRQKKAKVLRLVPKKPPESL